MNIHSSLLTTLLVSILATPTLAKQPVDTTTYPSTQQQPSKNSASPNHQEVTASVNINTADAKTLLELKGIGLKRAQTIISYREQNGPFKSIDDLMHVKGIGQKTLDLNHGRITV